MTEAGAPPEGSLDGVVAVVQRADCAERVVVLEVRVPGLTSTLVIAVPRGATHATAGLLAAGARKTAWRARLPPGSDRQKPREVALEGAHVVTLGENEIYLVQQGEPRVLRGQGGRVVVTHASPPEGATPFVDTDAETRARAEARGMALLVRLAHESVDARRAEILGVLERASTRVERRREAIRGDLGKVTQADKLASQAQWLVAEAARTPRGATKLVVTDWSSGEAVPIEVPLDPSKSAREQVDAIFKRAKRLRLGATIAEDRLARAETQRDAIAHAMTAVREATDLAAIEDAAREAKRAAPRDVAYVDRAQGVPSKATKKGDAKRTPYRTFVARSGTKLFVGKGAADNDVLTQSARPHHLWLHAKDRTGAHVIVPLQKGHDCTSEDLVDAAHLAAHFSEAREEKTVDVQYTPKRYLRKPKGSAPGAVVVDREKVLVLRVEPAILAGLLEREDTG